MRRILLLTIYDSNSASSRIRHISVIPDLLKLGYEVVSNPFFEMNVLENRYRGLELKKWIIFRSYLKRFRQIAAVNKYEAVWIEKEFLPYAPNWVEAVLLYLIRKPILIDLDDDWFAKYRSQIPAFLRLFLGKYKPINLKKVHYSTSNNSIYNKIVKDIHPENCHFINPYIDLEKYSTSRKVHSVRKERDIKLGWIGSPISSKLQLLPNIELLRILARNYQVHLIGADAIFSQIPYVSVIEWRLETEIKSMLECDIAIMPLTEEEFTKGKSGYKAIQFMSLGIPVVSSDLANSKQLLAGGRGVIATTNGDWMSAVQLLANDIKIRTDMGNKSKEWVTDNYKKEKFLTDLDSIFVKLIN